MKTNLKLFLLLLLCCFFSLANSDEAIAGPADLIVINQTATPTSVNRGSTVTVTARVKNQGSGTAVSGSVIRYYFSEDNVFSSNDVLLGGNQVGQIGSGDNQFVSKTLTIPSDARLNWNHCIIFVADHTNVVPESNENNNIAMREVFVAPCNAPGMPGTISGPSSFCPADGGFYSVAAVSGATSYVWAIPSGLNGSSTSRSIFLTGNNAGTYTICVSAKNSCGTSAPRCRTVSTRFNLCFDDCYPPRPWCEDIPYKTAQTKTTLEEANTARLSTSVSVFPNPASTSITLQTHEGDGIARIVGLDGSTIKEFLVSAPNMLLDIADLPKGIYLINVLTSKGILTEKLVKQ